MTNTLLRRIAGGAAADNTGTSRDELFGDPQAIQAHAATVFLNVWAGMVNDLPWSGLAAQSMEITTSSDVVHMWDLSQEPRQPFINTTGESTTGGPHQDYPPWHRFFEGESYTNDMLFEMTNRHTKIIDPTTGVDQTTRTVIWARWLHAQSYLYLGMLWDKAPIIPLNTDLHDVPNPTYAPYQDVFAEGVAEMEDLTTTIANQRSDCPTTGLYQCAVVDTATPFVIPRSRTIWLLGQQLGSGDLGKVIRTYYGRSLAYVARNPAERQATDWDKVISLIGPGSGITTDFGPGGFGTGLNANGWLNLGYFRMLGVDTSTGNGSNRSNSNTVRVNLRLIGPGDTTGAYQTWLTKADKAGRDTVRPVQIGTPDRRIQGPGGTPGGRPPDGTIFKYTGLVPPNVASTSATGMPSDRGPYYYSNYYSWRTVQPDGCNVVSTNTTNGCMWALQTISLTVDEVNLLLAEAYFRKGDLPSARDLINISRVRDGQLPAVTVAGPPQGTPAEIASCVPKRFDGTCGNLWDALAYEKGVQLYGREGIIRYADMRGWGCLLEGSLLHMPVPANELQLQSQSLYTTGGVGLPGGAPLPQAFPAQWDPKLGIHVT